MAEGWLPLVGVGVGLDAIWDSEFPLPLGYYLFHRGAIIPLREFVSMQPIIEFALGAGIAWFSVKSMQGGKEKK